VGCLKLSYYFQGRALAKEPVFFMKGSKINARVSKNYKDYYPGGMLMPGRSFNSNSYRFGFNRKPKDDEITNVTGANLDFGAREFDSRIIRWWTIDKEVSKSPGFSPYCFAFDNPILFIDDDGNFPNYVHERIQQQANASTHIQKLSNEYLQGLVQGAYDADYYFFYKKYHGDNLKDLGAVTNFLSDRRSSISNLNDGVQSGYNYHGIQDIYSHSNYIPLYLEYLKATGTNMSSLKPEDIPSLQRALENDDFRDKYGDQIKTGNWDLLKSGKDDPDSHYNMNLDSPDDCLGSEIIEGTSFPLSDFAEGAAINGTKEELINDNEQKGN
jgi:RHS repeat-associated protein